VDVGLLEIQQFGDLERREMAELVERVGVGAVGARIRGHGDEARQGERS